MATSTLAGVVSFGSSKLGIGGVTVRLLEGSTQVSGESPIQTGSDGSYTFTGLSQGTYTIEVVPSPDYSTWTATTTGSSPSGTASGQDEIQVTIGSGVHGTGYDFNAQSTSSTMLSAQLFLASAPALTQTVQGRHTAPTVNLSGGSATAFATTYQAGGSAAAIASSSATITTADNNPLDTLVWLKATITNPDDGALETLTATIPAGSPITQTYAGNVLTLSGVDYVSDYLAVLQSITYSDTASAQPGDRKITVVVNDGTASSQAATATVTVQATATANTLSTLAGVVTWGSAKLGIGGVTLRLLSSGGTEVTAGQSPVQTATDGSYTFNAVPQGSYTIQLVPSPDYSTWTATTTGSSPSGTASGQDEIQVTLGSGVNGTGYDFTAQGTPSTILSARLFFASAPPMTQIVQGLHTAPTVNLSGGSSGTAFATTYQAGGSAAAIASSSATITTADNNPLDTLVGLKATITNSKDGALETLAATTTNTPITSIYAGNVLTLSGVAYVSDYLKVLQSITYSDTASSPQTGDRKITVVVNDGTASSQAATATVTVQAAITASAATDSALAQTSNWL
jgi:hypothetical protein